MDRRCSRNLSIIYDGQCSFCIRTLKVLKRWDMCSALDFYDFHDEEIMREKFSMVKSEDAQAAMLVVTREGGVFKGFYAFRRLVWKVPRLWALVVVLYLPGLSYIGTRVYEWVARNRKNFGCDIHGFQK